MEFENVDQDETYANETGNSFESDGISNNNAKSVSDLVLKNNIMKIFVYQPYVRIRSIRLDAFYSISVLNRMYPADSTYIFNGQILDVEKSFYYYNIQNENKIVLISSNMMKSNPNFIQKWIDLTSRKDYFEERINLNIKNDYRKEIARMKDIKYLRMENKKRHFGHFVKSQFRNQSKLSDWANDSNKNIENSKLNVDYDSLNNPSNDPLPIIW